MNIQMKGFQKSGELLAFVSVALTGSLVVGRMYYSQVDLLWILAAVVAIGLYFFEARSHWKLRAELPFTDFRKDIFMFGPLALSIVVSGFFLVSATLLLSLELIFSLNYGKPFRPKLYGVLVFFMTLGALFTAIAASKLMKPKPPLEWNGYENT